MLVLLGDNTRPVANLFPCGVCALLDDLHKSPKEELLPARELRERPPDVIRGRNLFLAFLVMRQRSPIRRTYNPFPRARMLGTPFRLCLGRSGNGKLGKRRNWGTHRP